jgi:NAD(P)-dependent dehydrogenase (short-subunit alcohol dehydrogenase family)
MHDLPRVRGRRTTHLKPIDEQVVVIVGASRGIGRQTATRFAERGARLVLASRDAEALAEVEVICREAGAADVAVIPADVKKSTDMEALAKGAVERFGRIDSWVHIAGVDLWSTFEKTTPKEFRQIIETNLLGPAYGAQAALPALRAAGGGALIAVSSVEAEVPLPWQSAYAASKHGMDAFLRTLRMELEAEGAPIAVTQIQPSGIDTPLFKWARTRIGVEPKPTAPVYDPDVVAQLILHAAEHPSRELVAGGGGWALRLAHRLAPDMTDRAMTVFGFAGQKTKLPKSDEAPNNLDQPPPFSEVRGGFGGRRFSIANQVQMLPAAVRVAAIGTLAAVVGLALRSRRA